MIVQGVAGGLAIVSLALSVGWQGLKNKSQTRMQLNQRWIDRTAEFFYFVGLPYLALISGVLTPRRLGLKGLEYFTLSSNETSALVGVQKAVTLLLVECLVDSGAVWVAGLTALIVLGVIALGLAQHGIRLTFEVSLIKILYSTLHWAFYWALFWLITDELYYGVVLGTGWVILEWSLISRLQNTYLIQQTPRLMGVTILILIATIFYFYPNLWLLWLIHLAMVLLLNAIYTRIATHQKYINHLD